MHYLYKQLTSADSVAMRELLGVFGEAFGDREAYIENQPSEEYLKNLLGKEDFIALAAQDESGKVVGGLAAYVLEKFEQERKEIYIYDLAVAEANRRQGVASGLIAELQKIAKEMGAYVIYVQADHGDEAAIALYEKFGKKEEVLHFDIPPAA